MQTLRHFIEPSIQLEVKGTLGRADMTSHGRWNRAAIYCSQGDNRS